MDNYPPQYAAHEHPLVLLSGLLPVQDPESPLHKPGPVIEATLPIVQSPSASDLAQEFESHQAAPSQWSGSHSKSKVPRYNFKLASRKYVLPRRKADPSRDGSHTVPHSILSPLTNSESPYPQSLYPDGIFTPAWFDKHQSQVPCVFIAFFDLTDSPTGNTMNDNRLQSDIGAIKSALKQSEYRSRLTIILLGIGNIRNSTAVDDRVTTIRRSLNLDPQTGLFYLQPSPTPSEIIHFVDHVLTTLHSHCVTDYYKQLSRRTRSKKNRGSPPSPPPAVRPLSDHDWDIRYNIKLGVWAEFRQEIGGARGHYNTALDALMDKQGPFGILQPWNPRWDQARLLLDTLAFRIIRCCLWERSWTTATQSWCKYRDRMYELIDRRGSNTTSYSWRAWEATWAAVMADLIRQAHIPAFLSLNDSSKMTASEAKQRVENRQFLTPELYFRQSSTFPPPWHRTHHAGYWMGTSAHNAKWRYLKALAVPSDDKKAPVSEKDRRRMHMSYDTYMCEPPHIEAVSFDHVTDIVARHKSALVEFSARSQSRFAHRIDLDIAGEYLRAKRYDEALPILKTLSAICTWRRDKWWIPLFQLNSAIFECATQLGDVESAVLAVFELHHPSLCLNKGMRLDLMSCGKLKTRSSTTKSQLALKSSPYQPSFLSAYFLFDQPKSHVGDTILAQLRIFSSAHENTSPITLSKVTCKFKNHCYQLTNSNTHPDPSTPKNGSILPQAVDLTGTYSTKHTSNKPNGPGLTTFTTTTDLSLYPGRKLVVYLDFDVKELGDIGLESIVAEIDTDEYFLEFTVDSSNFDKRHEWYVRNVDTFLRRPIVRSEPWTLEVHPRPSKLSIDFIHASTLFTDQNVDVEYTIVNNEADEIQLSLTLTLILSNGDVHPLKWPQDTPTLSPGASLTHTATFEAPPDPMDMKLDLQATYYLPSDLQIPLTKTSVLILSIKSPFDYTFRFAAYRHPDPWSTIFSIHNPIPGLRQRWQLTALLNRAELSEHVLIKRLALRISSKPSYLDCNLVKDVIAIPHVGDTDLDDLQRFDFLLDTLRAHGNENVVQMFLSLDIDWIRSSGHASEQDSPPVTTTVLTTEVAVASLEPRVLAAVSTVATPILLEGVEVDANSKSRLQSGEQSLYVRKVVLTLENPLAHPRYYEIAVPTTDNVAFSGSKQQSQILLPYSRTDLEFFFLPLVQHAWATAHIRVKDRGSGNEVDILPTTGCEAWLELGKQKIRVASGIRFWVD